MTAANKTPTSKYMSGDIRHLINQAIQNELVNLPTTPAEIKDPVQRLNFLTKFMPFDQQTFISEQKMRERVNWNTHGRVFGNKVIGRPEFLAE